MSFLLMTSMKLPAAAYQFEKINVPARSPALSGTTWQFHKKSLLWHDMAGTL